MGQLRSGGGSLRLEPGVESGRHRREAVDFLPPRFSSSSPCCGAAEFIPKAVMRVLCWLGWQAARAPMTSRPRDCGGCGRHIHAQAAWEHLASPPSRLTARQAKHAIVRALPVFPSRRFRLPPCLLPERWFSISRRFTRSIHALSGVYKCSLIQLFILNDYLVQRTSTARKARISHPLEAQCCYNRTVV